MTKARKKEGIETTQHSALKTMSNNVGVAISIFETNKVQKD